MTGGERLSKLQGAELRAFRVYLLDPEEPPFLGFLIMISLYKSLKR